MEIVEELILSYQGVERGLPSWQCVGDLRALLQGMTIERCGTHVSHFRRWVYDWLSTQLYNSGDDAVASGRVTNGVINWDDHLKLDLHTVVHAERVQMVCLHCGRARARGFLWQLGVYYCESCARIHALRYCTQCGQLDGRPGRTPNPFCGNCAGPSCLACNLPLKKEDFKGGLCEKCCTDGYLVPYGAGAPKAFKWERSAKNLQPLQGVELEVICPKPNRLVLREVVGDFALLKSDSSLTRNGTEIVTLPMSTDDHRAKWLGLEGVLAERCQIDDSCGLHTHLDRPDQATAEKLFYMVQRPANEDLLVEVAGRPLDTEWAQKYYFRTPPVNPMKCISQQHHSAINLSMRNKGNTIELRIFASTLDPKVLIGRLEFGDSLRHFCGQTSLRKTLARDYKDWLIKEPSYKYLKKLLGLRKIWPGAGKDLRNV